jgi:hypothetical protein
VVVNGGFRLVLRRDHVALCDLKKIYFRSPFCHGLGIAQTKSGLSL